MTCLCRYGGLRMFCCPGKSTSGGVSDGLHASQWFVGFPRGGQQLYSACEKDNPHPLPANLCKVIVEIGMENTCMWIGVLAENG
jgi:hypothetical protein